MVVKITVSTSGNFKVISSVNATLTTAITEVINQLEKEQVSHNQTQFSLTHDGTNYVYLASVKLK